MENDIHIVLHGNDYSTSATWFQSLVYDLMHPSQQNPADKENIGPIEYTPTQTIRSNFFPYENQHGYLSPFVMVRFANPARGVLINIECKAWANNIKHDRTDREGSVHFELLID